MTTKGETVWLEDWQECIYLIAVGDGHVVEASEEHKNTEALKVDTLKSLIEVEALRHIQNFIAGKITHFLGVDYKTELITFQDAMECDDEYTHRPNPMRLMSLFGNSEGDLTWKINRYQDGSGVWKTWLPFTSYEDAKTALSEHAAEQFSKYLAGERVSYLGDLMEECGKHSVLIPRNVLDKFESIRSKGVKDRIDEHESKIAELQEQLGSKEQDG